MIKAQVVIGLGFGDEGKGRVVSYLSSQGSPSKLVVRFNGGHQAGHTVISEGRRHVFSSFGSGTLQRLPTYISRFCTVYPKALLNELELLAKMGLKPRVYIDPLAMITTPFDVDINRADNSGHGTCGVGFGATIERNEKFFHLYAQDLLYPSALNAKLIGMAAHYKPWRGIHKADHVADFIQDVDEFLQFVDIVPHTEIPYDDIIFEGAQGILLDMDFGFFPNVTRSNTTSKNAQILAEEMGVDRLDMYYVTRSYQTRHGHGFMTNEGEHKILKPNGRETNVTNDWQGKFRLGMLDVDLLSYALACEATVNNPNSENHLVVTCLDQTGEEFQATQNGERIGINARWLYKGLDGDFPLHQVHGSLTDDNKPFHKY
jgi:adenylosuccinate synthase